MKHAIAAFLASTLIASAAWACSCRPLDRAEIIKDSAAAFTGRVLSSRKTDPDINRGEVVARVRILKAYKGVRRGRIITLKTAPNGALCGIGMSKGDVVSVAANRDRPGVFSTGLCMQLP